MNSIWKVFKRNKANEGRNSKTGQNNLNGWTKTTTKAEQSHTN